MNNTWKKLEMHTYEYSELTKIKEEDTYLTFQIDDFIRYIKSLECINLPTIIDYECFTKQFQQTGKENKRTWKALSFLQDYGKVDSSFKLTESNLKEFMILLTESYKELQDSHSEEKKRFDSIENPVNRILYARQLKGVRFDEEKAKSRVEELETTIYRIKNTLQFDYEIFDPESINFHFEYLKKKAYPILKNSIEYTIKAKRNSDPICRLIYELIRLKIDFNSILTMLRLYGGKEFVHPSYKGFGTITSRITMRDPSIQNMKRENRDILIPNNGMEFLYIDYSQFEAGILASLSKDKRLIALYKTDIYRDIAENLLGDKEKREHAKIIFYMFMYGSEHFTKDETTYFNKYPALNEYVHNVNKELNQNGIIFSPHGNGRKFIDGTTSIWALSHKIQSTASLIYKNALLRAFKEVPNADFVIPMHDATLYEVPINEVETIRLQLIRIYEDEFKKICPDIDPVINHKPFHSK
jgi:DNA polymerase I-like protein with 3'-5' exonuclease and polymerase domains